MKLSIILSAGLVSSGILMSAIGGSFDWLIQNVNIPLIWVLILTFVPTNEIIKFLKAYSQKYRPTTKREKDK